MIYSLWQDMILDITVLQCCMYWINTIVEIYNHPYGHFCNFIKVLEDISPLIWKSSVVSDGESQVFNLCGVINTLRVI